MPVGEEALAVEDDLAIAARRDDRLDRVGRLALQGAAWGNDGDPHGRCLWMETPSVRNDGYLSIR
jgi:hypothetical protein